MKNIFRDSALQSKHDSKEISLLIDYIKNSPESDFNKFDNFTKYVQKGSISRFIARYEVYKMQINIPGVIVDIGVGRGASLFTWANLSSIFEPTNYTREIFGFDTFTGMEKIENKDKTKKKSKTEFSIFKPKEDTYKDILNAIKVYDTNRPLSHIQKIYLYKGNVKKTFPKFIKENPHALVSLLHLDVDVYEPTKIVLKNIIKRMPKGAIILFGELATRLYPGETRAMLEELNIKKKSLKRFPFATTMSYLVI